VNRVAELRRLTAVGSGALLGINWWYIIIFIAGSAYGWVTCMFSNDLINIRPHSEIVSNAIELPGAASLGNKTFLFQQDNGRLMGRKNDGVTPLPNEVTQYTLTIWRQSNQVSIQVCPALQVPPTETNGSQQSGNRSVE
jgi:hypothetical protein